MLIYDIFWIYFSENIFGKRMMTTILRNELKEKLQNKWNSNNGMVVIKIKKKIFFIVGYCDVIFPVMFLFFLRKFDRVEGKKNLNSYFLLGLICCILAFVSCFFLALYKEIPQPGFVLIAPTMTIPLFLKYLLNFKWNLRNILS